MPNSPAKEWAIRLLTPDDSVLLSDLAITIYKQYYTHLWHDAGDWYIDFTYNPVKIKNELSDLSNFHYAAYSDQKPVGYIKLRLSEKAWIPEVKNSLEVDRIYILQEAAHAGLGRKLMDIALEVAKYHNQEGLYLKAMDSSLDALAFYKRLGFEIVDTFTLPFEQMKRKYRGMYVLRKLVTGN